MEFPKVIKPKRPPKPIPARRGKKRKRSAESNPKNLSGTRSTPCIACGYYKSDPDHIQSRGAGGGDELANLWPLCRIHHMERHRIGLSAFVESHMLEAELMIRGFTINRLTNRWFKPKS